MRLRSKKPVLYIFLGMTLLLMSCGKNLMFMPSTVVPAADGKVNVNKDNNDNYAIDVKVHNLGDPARLDPPKAHYTLWMETVDSGPKNLGNLDNHSAIFSKSKKASLETVSPFRPLRFFITAEDQLGIQYPSTQVVLSSENYDK
jgi:hypothetical protein